MSVSKNTTKRMLWRIIHTLESKSKGGGAGAEEGLKRKISGRDGNSVF